MSSPSAFHSALFGAPFHIDNRTVTNCGFWLEYAFKTPLEVVADLPCRMRLFWLQSQVMRLQSIHIKPLLFSAKYLGVTNQMYIRSEVDSTHQQYC